MLKTKKITFLLLFFLAFIVLPKSVQAKNINNIEAPEYRMKTTLDNSETFIYGYSVTEYGAVGDGITDNTEVFQKLINKMGSLGGGIIYVPAGNYVIRGNLSVPRGVILRGDWLKPDKNKPIKNQSVLMAYTGRNGNERSTPFIELCIESAVMDMTIWYPEQTPDNIVPYSPTIRFGFNNYFGNEYSNVNHVTLVNSYIGVLFNYDNFGASPIVNNLYGTTLCKGVEVDKIADVGRIDGVDFSSEYWINSGFANAPTNKEAFRDYMKSHAIGVVMRRNDWSFTCNLTVDGYKSGFNAEYTTNENERSTPNGHNYNFNITNCETGITINATNGVGILFTHINISNCRNGILINEHTGDIAQFINTDITASKYAIRIDPTSSTKLLFNDSKVHSGQVSVNSGTLISQNSAYNNMAPQIYYGLSGRGMLSGCSFKYGKSIMNNSIYSISIIDSLNTLSGINVKPDTNTFDRVEFDSHTPVRRVMYNASLSPYNVKTSNYDNTSNLQSALNKAAADGGGIVFLPSGKYKIRGHLIIPSNVELRGSVDLKSVPHGSGTIFEAYENRNNEIGDCFIQLKSNSGIRAIVVDYPEQVFDGIDTWNPAPYPYTIQGQGNNVYVINCSVRACYKAIDFNTYRCDNHYVDFIGGQVFMQGVFVGNNCNNGKIYNTMFNVLIYACGNESKFGSFSNMPNNMSSDRIYYHSFNNLEFMILGDCKNEILYNDFHYGSYKGLKLINQGNGGPNGVSMGYAIDGAIVSIEVGSGTTGTFDFYNTQVVSTGNSPTEKLYYKVDPNSYMTLNIYNSDYWGQPLHGIECLNNTTTLNLYGSHFENPGDMNFCNAIGGKINIMSSNLNQRGLGFTEAGSERYLNFINTNANNRNNATSAFNTWVNNQPYATLSTEGLLSNISRSSWSVSSSNNNANAYKAIDGNIETRWDTSAAQTYGQWFTLDLGATTTFNTLILDLGASTGDAPTGYEVYVGNSADNINKLVASGKRASIIKFDIQTARYIKIVQTGSFGNYWSIHELYVLNSSNLNDLPNGEVDITPVTNNEIKICGFQISYLRKGFRVISAIDPYINGHKVVRSGNIYGLALRGVKPEDMYFNSPVYGVNCFYSTSNGLSSVPLGTSATANYYIMTMVDNGSSAYALTAQYYVRAFAELDNGEYVYSDIKSFSIYDIADYLYSTKQMPNLTGHDYLYNDILTVVDSKHEKIDYDYNNAIIVP
ncbi:MAG: discoidin domain-containing protein [Lachnospiraceae bacterium]|nr:discoidin domain-containing protein [Lachnospiraceae bacterium]